MNITRRDLFKMAGVAAPGAAVGQGPRMTTEGHRETLRTNGWNLVKYELICVD